LHSFARLASRWNGRRWQRLGPAIEDTHVEDAPPADARPIDARPEDAGPRCPACPGTVVEAWRGIGFHVDCPSGEVVDFAGTPSWFGPGTDLITNACATESTPGHEPSFYVCCEPSPDAGSDADASSGDFG
jgi:hypothetical protein